MERGQRRIVCAANREPGTGEIILGARHWDMTMRAAYDVWKKANQEEAYKAHFQEQGFVDQWGIFLNRQEAWKVAEAAGQILYRCGGDDSNGGTLYSENLY